MFFRALTEISNKSFGFKLSLIENCTSFLLGKVTVAILKFCVESNLSKMLKLFELNVSGDGTLGLDLSRAPWDPYPWISHIRNESNAYAVGLRTGDTLVELNGCNVLGLRIVEIADLLKDFQQKQCTTEANPAKVQSNDGQSTTSTNTKALSVLIWRYKALPENNSHSHHQANPQLDNVVSFKVNKINEQKIQH